MLKKLLWGLWIGVACFTTAGTQTACAQNSNLKGTTTDNQRQLGQVQQARQLIGQELKTAQGEKLGKIEDFVVDLESGRILYGVVNIANASRVIPADLLQPAADQKSVTTEATKQQINTAPAMPKGITGGQIGSVNFATSVSKHFNHTGWWNTDTAAAKGKMFGNAHRVNQLLNLEVQNSSNEKVGKIQNVVLDLKSGRVAFLILDPSTLLGQANHQLAIPPNAFTKGTGNFLVTGLDKNTLNAAPRFNNNWAELSDPTKAGSIYSYYGKQPYFGLSATGRP